MLNQDELDQIKQLIQDIINQSMTHAAMKLEAIRVSALIAENQALKLQIIAMEQQLLQMDKKLQDTENG